MSPSFMKKTMVYLGLLDDEYDEYDDLEDRAPAASRPRPGSSPGPRIRSLPRSSAAA